MRVRRLPVPVPDQALGRRHRCHARHARVCGRSQISSRRRIRASTPKPQSRRARSSSMDSRSRMQTRSFEETRSCEYAGLGPSAERRSSLPRWTRSASPFISVSRSTWAPAAGGFTRALLDRGSRRVHASRFAPAGGPCGEARAHEPVRAGLSPDSRLPHSHSSVSFSRSEPSSSPSSNRNSSSGSPAHPGSETPWTRRDGRPRRGRAGPGGCRCS